MSLVLAFGLSPIGQAPAYAAEKGGTVSAQSAEISPQAALADWTIPTKGTAFTYSAKPQAPEISGNVIITVSGDKTYVETKNDYALTYYKNNAAYKDDPSSDALTPAAQVSDETVAATVAPTNAGDYVMRVTITNAAETDKNVKDTYEDVKFTISPFSLADATVTFATAGPATYTGVQTDVTLTNVKATADKLNGGDPVNLTLRADYTLDNDTGVAKIGEIGDKKVTVHGAGNFKDSKDVTMSIGQVAFASPAEPAVLKIAGKVPTKSGKYYVVDLTSSSDAQEYGKVVDPISSVVIGDEPLDRGENADYTVTYYDGPDYTKAKVVDAFQKEPGTYAAVVTGVGPYFEPTGNGDPSAAFVVVSYKVGDTGKAISDAVKKVEIADGTYAFGAGVKPSTISFKDASNNAVSVSKDDYAITYNRWTEELEKERLGSAYTNEYANTEDGKYVNLLDVTDENYAKTEAATAAPQAAGDYQVVFTGKGRYAGGTVYGKYTVKPLQAAQGSGTGDFVVQMSKKTSEYSGAEIADPFAAEGAVRYIADASKADDDGKYISFVGEGSEVSAHAFGVNYIKASDREKAKSDPEAAVRLAKEDVVHAGKYDVEIVFGANAEGEEGAVEFATDTTGNYEPLYIEDAYEITKFNIAKSSLGLNDIVLQEDDEGAAVLDYNMEGQDPTLVKLVQSRKSWVGARRPANP